MSHMKQDTQQHGHVKRSAKASSVTRALTVVDVLQEPAAEQALEVHQQSLAAWQCGGVAVWWCGGVVVWQRAM